MAILLLTVVFSLPIGLLSFFTFEEDMIDLHCIHRYFYYFNLTVIYIV